MLNIETVLYIYLTACLSLMLYNFIYMIGNDIKQRDQTRHVKYWHREITEQTVRTDGGYPVHPRHGKKLSGRLANPNALVYYSQAMELIKRESPESVKRYLYANYTSFQYLAYRYGRKDSIERAYYADFIRRFPPCGENYAPIADILISYMENSTVYCRENVLRSLYALGNVRAVENALQLLNDRGWYHHQKLISDGLAAFTGDTEALAEILWGKYGKWDGNIMLSVVNFITNISPGYGGAFFPVLTDPSADVDIRIAVMRYYRRYPYEKARSVLLKFLTGRQAAARISKNRFEDDSLAIVAASVLEQYPQGGTADVLIRALSDQNWHIRYNAASSLIAMKTPRRLLDKVLDGGDKYASDILSYRLAQAEGEGR